MSARCEEVIITTEKRGAGVDGDPVREITVVYAKDGTRIAERDGYEAQLALLGWITDESISRLSAGGNDSRGSVPIHARRSAVAATPVYVVTVPK